VDHLSYKTKSLNRDAIQKEWYVVDASQKVLGRMASEIAKVIRGKHKPTFTPNIDCGDKVIVINAKKVRLTGKKMDDKVYVRHTGYPGGQRFSTPRLVLQKYPNRLIEMAVRGMLPKNSLGRKVFKNLFIYEGDHHPHEAQNPKELKLK